MFNKDTYLNMTFAKREDAKILMSTNEKRCAQHLDKKLRKDGDKLLKECAKAQEEKIRQEQVISDAGTITDPLSGIIAGWCITCNSYHPDNYAACAAV